MEEPKETAVPVQAEVPKVKIKIEDENKVVQEENEKNQEKNKEANESSEADKSTPELKYKYKEGTAFVWNSSQYIFVFFAIKE